MGYALDLLNAEDGAQRPFLNDLYNPVILGVAGFGLFSFSNYILRKPLLSGIQRHIVFGIGGVFLGLYANKLKDAHFAERDAVLRHYVELHSDDFPDPQRKKFGEILMRWHAIR